MLEQVLVEKVAVALWRQRRLVAAEAAIIEQGRKPSTGIMAFLTDSGEVITAAAAELDRVRQSAPVRNELLARYSTGLDTELYRAIEQLRKQQEFRLRQGAIIDADVG